MDYRKRGATSQSVRILAIKNDGTLLTGLTKDSVNLVISFLREKSSAAIAYSGANIEEQTTVGTYQAPSSSSKCRFKETALPAWYEIQVHDDSGVFGSADASEKIQVTLSETTTTDLAIGLAFKEIQLGAFDLQQALVDVGKLNGSAAAAAFLAIAAGLYRSLTIDETNFTPTATEFETAEAPSAKANIVVDRSIVFASGGIVTQPVYVVAYSVVSGKGHWTVSPMVEAPQSGDTALLI
jgi:hypothetical protein